MALIRTMKQLRHLAVLVFVLLSTSACSDLDPVKVTSKCDGTGTIDARCAQCLTERIASNCQQCQMSPPDDKCLPPGVPWDSTTSANMLPDGSIAQNEGGESAAPDGSSPNNEAGGSGGSGASNAQPRGGAGAADAQGGAGSGGNGSGGKGSQVPSGAAGEKPSGPGNAPPSRCSSDADCSSDPAYPACRGDGKCTVCTKDSHCPNGMQCDTTTNGCVECRNNDGCSAQGKVCFTEAAMCVQCNSDPDCPADAHACTTEHTCVACVGNEHCPAEAPTCVDNTCVECNADSDCQNGKHACIADEHRCVECQQESQCRGVSGRPHCDANDSACVECLKDADCSDPSASHCDASSHSCVPCSSNTHCAAFAGTAPRCASGECVACDRDGGICNGKACILSSNVCSDKARQSVAACGECQSSDECIAGHVCVPTTFMARSAGNRCLPNFADYKQAGKPCPRPYSRKVSKPETVDLPVDTLCELPDATSCEALLDTLGKKACGGNNLNCGLGMYDGYCGVDGCSYTCTSNDFCPNSMTCSEAMHVCL